MKIHFIGVAIAAFSFTAFAQTPAAPAASTAQAPLAAHGCTPPPMPDASKSYTANESNAYVRTLETFRSCIQKFSEGQKAIVAAKQKEAETLRLSAMDAFQAAKSAAEAADAAAKEYNAFSEQVVKIVTPKPQAAETQKSEVKIEPPAPRPQRGN